MVTSKSRKNSELCCVTNCFSAINQKAHFAPRALLWLSLGSLRSFSCKVNTIQTTIGAKYYGVPNRQAGRKIEYPERNYHAGCNSALVVH